METEAAVGALAIGALGTVWQIMVAGVLVAFLGGVAGVLGMLMFGRGYKRRISDLETQISDLKARQSALPPVNIYTGANSIQDGHQVFSPNIAKLLSLTQAEYDAMDKPSDDTLYFVS